MDTEIKRRRKKKLEEKATYPSIEAFSQAKLETARKTLEGADLATFFEKIR